MTSMFSSSHRVRLLFSALAILFAVPSASAQCATNWASNPALFSGRVNTMVTLPNGDLIAGGRFATVGGVTANNIARWDGSSWSVLGSGVSHLTGGAVYGVVGMPNGDLIATGWFDTAGGAPANHIARWDGVSWSSLGNGLEWLGNALTVLPNGDLVVGGNFLWAGSPSSNTRSIARWDGSSWASLGTGITGSVRTLATMPNGDLVAGGSLSISGLSHAGIARWNGSAWQHIGINTPTSGSDVFALEVMPNGDLIAGGYFTSIGGVAADKIARWDGVAWSPIGSGLGAVGTSHQVRAVKRLPNGDLLAAGRISSVAGAPADNIARWNGLSWSDAGTTGINGMLFTMTTRPNGDVVVGGGYVVQPSPNFATLTTTCPATVVSLGGGCASSGGSNWLTATLPWAGSAWKATGTALPASAFVAFVNGFSQVSAPLTLIFPQAASGCSLLASTDLVHVLVASNGTAEGELLLPNTPALSGIVFYSQMVPFELDATLGLISVTSTDVLEVTVGSF